MGLHYFVERLSARKRSTVLVVSKQFCIFRNKKWRFWRKTPCRFILTGEFFGLDFAGFHVRLVERVDTNDRTGHGRGDFPAEKLLAQRVHVRKSNSNHWMPGFFNRRNRCVLSFVRFICQTQVGENSFTSI